MTEYMEDTGEVNCLVSAVLRREVSVSIINQDIIRFFASRNATKTWAKAVAMMRHGFGGRPFGEDKGLQHERPFGRGGDFPQEDKPAGK